MKKCLKYDQNGTQVLSRSLNVNLKSFRTLQDNRSVGGIKKRNNSRTFDDVTVRGHVTAFFANIDENTAFFVLLLLCHRFQT